MRKIFLPLLLVALSPVAHSEGVQEVEIDAPLSGWHPAEGEDARFFTIDQLPGVVRQHGR